MLNEPFSRLLQEQRKATAQTESRINQLIAFQSEYEELIIRLELLQKSVCLPALIPFGRKSLVHGRLIHTNEILAHLGGGGAGEHDYFAQLSTHDAVKLINRRIGNIAGQITLLQQQRKLIEDRIPYTSKLANKLCRVVKNSTAQDITLGSSDHSSDGEEVEIQEDYDSDAELEWQEQHRRRYRQERGLEASTASLNKKVSFDLSNLHDQLPHSCESSASSTQTEDVDCEATIYFSHSKSPVAVSSVSPGNSCWLTPSAAVDVVIKHGLIQLQQNLDDTFPPKLQLNPLQEDPTDYSRIPFSGAICEHKSTPKLQTAPSSDPTKISRFRSSRLPSNVN